MYYIVHIDKMISELFGISVAEAKRKRLEGAVEIAGKIVRDLKVVWYSEVPA